MILLNDDLLYIIYEKLNSSDKLNFIKINKYIYNLFKIDMLKYCIINLLNKDYPKFYYFFNKYKFNSEFNNLLFKKAISDIKTVWSYNGTNGHYDLRYIFEIMLIENNLDESSIEILNNHFYIFFYNNLKNCIIYKNRVETLKFINSRKCYGLSSLKENFNLNFSPKGKFKKWDNLIKN